MVAHRRNMWGQGKWKAIAYWWEKQRYYSCSETLTLCLHLSSGFFIYILELTNIDLIRETWWDSEDIKRACWYDCKAEDLANRNLMKFSKVQNCLPMTELTHVLIQTEKQLAEHQTAWKWSGCYSEQQVK